jgi:hypothetical protein
MMDGDEVDDILPALPQSPTPKSSDRKKLGSMLTVNDTSHRRRLSSMSMRSMKSMGGQSEAEPNSPNMNRASGLIKSKYKSLVLDEVTGGSHGGGGHRKSTMRSDGRMQTLADIGEHNLAIM